MTGGAAGIGRGIVGALLDEGCRVVIADIEAPVLERTVAELAERGDVRGVVTDVSDTASVEALADNVYERVRGLPRAVEQRRGHLGWRRQPVGTGAQRLAVVLRGQRVRHGQRRAGVRAPHDGRRRAGRGGDHLVGRRRHRPGALRLGLRLVQGGHQLLHRGAGPPVPGPGDQAAAAVFYPSGGLLETGLWEAQRNRPAELARVRPRPPAPGTTFAEFKAALAAAGRPTDVVDLDELGRFAVQGVKDGKFVIGHNLDAAGPLLHARADAIAEGTCRRRPSRDWGDRQRGRPAEPTTPGDAMTIELTPDRRYTVIIGRRPRRRRHPRLPALPGRAGGTTSSTPGPPPTSTRSPTCWPRPPTGAGTRTGGWPRTRPTASPPRSSSPTPCPRSSRRAACWPCRRRPADYDRRWAGLQAHNRWLADFCAKVPGRRAGVAQVFANDMDDALAEVRWAAANIRPSGGILLPRCRPGSGCPACGSRTTSRCGSCARSSAWWSTSTAAAGCPTTASPRWPGPSCWSSCPGSPTGRRGTSSSVGCSSATPVSRSSSPSRAWAGCPGASRRSTGSTAG